MSQPDAPVSAERSTHVRYLVLFAACSLAVITYIHRVGFANASSAVRGELGLTQVQLGNLMAAFMIAYGLFEVPWGMLGDRRGARGVLTIVALAGSLITAAVALTTMLPRAYGVSFFYLLLLRFLFGGFQAGTFPTIGRMLGDWMPTTERGTAQGALWMSARTGGAAAPLIVAPLIALLGSFRPALALVAALGLIWAVAFWIWFRNEPERMVGVNAAERELILRGRSGKKAAHGAVPWRALAASPTAWALCLMYGCLGYSGNFFLTLLNDYLSTQRHLPPGTIKWLESLPFALGVGACLLGGFASDRIIRRTGRRGWGRRAVPMLGMLVAACAIASVPSAPTAGLLGLALGLTFLGNDLAMAPAWAAVADHGEKHAGALGGLMNMTGSFAAAVGAMVTSRLLAAGHHQLPFALYGLAYAIGVACWLVVDASRTLIPPADPDP